MAAQSVKITTQKVTRVHVEGPMADADQLREHCYAQGFDRLVRSGPKLLSASQADAKTYYVIAERIDSEDESVGLESLE